MANANQKTAPVFRTITREDYLATVDSGWEVWEDRKTHGKRWWEECRTAVARRAGDDLPETPYASLEEARAAACLTEAQRLRDALSRVMSVLYPTGLRRLAYLAWRLCSRPRRDYLALARRVEAEALKRVAACEAGACDIQVYDIRPTLRVAGRLPVGTPLWLVSLYDPFVEGPVLAGVRVSEVRESLCVYEGDWRGHDQPEVDFTHIVQIPARDSGWEGPEGRERDCDLGLAGDVVPDELPWNVHCERLFYSREAAERCLLDQAEKCRRAAANAKASV